MKVLGVIMAGGKGERLYPLTKERSKPAVPFGGKYRILDFVLSNFVNSGIYSSYVLVQYLSQSLIEYMRLNWRSTGLTRDHFLTVVPPQMRLGEMWYRGTADAVRQNLNLIHDFKPDIVAVFGADHIYRMDISQMINFHNKSKSDVTISSVKVPLKQACSFGVLEVNEKDKVTAFLEKPENPKPLPDDPKNCYASMGNYIFTYDALMKILQEKYTESPGLDFGKGILPIIHKRYNVFAYDFLSQKLAGIKNYEEKGYWRDVGTIESYWQSNMDLLGNKPRLDLNNSLWPIHSASRNSPPAKYINAEIKDSMISDGCEVRNSIIKKSVIGRGVIIEDNCFIEESVIMDKCEINEGTKLKKVIIDRYNHIGPRRTIGFNHKADAQRYFIDPCGIVIIPRGKTR